MRHRRLLALGLALALAADGLWTLVLLPHETRERRHRIDDLPAEGAPALVLACGIEKDGTPSRLLEGRLRTALSLYRAGKARWLLMSGWDDEPEAMRRWLADRGVPRAAIVTDSGAQRTYESLQRAVALYGLRRLFVVTSDFHIPRTLWLAEHLGIDAEGVPASTREAPWRVRTGVNIREYAARNRAWWDVWFPPRMREGPHEAPPAGG